VDALGFVFQDGKAIVGPTMDMSYAESDCRFCGACAEVCPTGTIMDRDLPKGEREDVLVPCVANCPAGVDIPRYLDLISKGDYSTANAVVAERIPFPGLLGRICFHPCEDACRRGELNSPMGICGLKWFASDNSDAPTIDVKASTGKTVAVIGSGPAGLSAAYYLAVSGHGVTVFEAEEKVGGMLRYAIPDYRLPPDVLDSELAVFDGLNVEFRTGTKVGGDLRIGDIQNDFDAVFVGTGACLSKRIPVEGAERDGVMWGLDFLKDVKTGAVTALDGRVLVIGGGNVAIDVARSAVRLGASEVQLACLESRDEMPAHGWEIEEAAEEGVVMHPSWGPKRILGGGNVTGIELIKCTAVFDRNGCFAPEFDDSETQTIDTDLVILAIGQAADLECFEGAGIETSAGTICVEGCETGHPGTFAGGEVSKGPSSVVEAVADGALAASAIDRYLGGDGDVHAPVRVPGEVDPHVGHVEGFAAMDRVDVPKREVDERKTCFDPVEIGYYEDQAVSEAVRCLRCDLRLLIEPVTLPPDMWLELNEENVADVPATEGVVQLLNEEKMIIVIMGTQDMHAELEAKLGTNTKAVYFGIDADPMYSKRESELMQMFLQQFGKMPEGDGEGDDLDDLF
jgi:NADPH-dependent glutamate synthase beta subunit-like oxidoreductase